MTGVLRSTRPSTHGPSKARTGSKAWITRPRNKTRVHAANVDAVPAFVDFYELLGVEEGDSLEEIKASYRRLAKCCHPDIAGEDGHNMCVMLNEAYETLMDPLRKLDYDERRALFIHDEDAGYTGEPLSKWCGPGHAMSKCSAGNEEKAVFVDEGTCIGCTNCVHTASATFRLEKDHGRARVFAQWVNTEDEIQEAIDTCPVDCIHWVDKDQLPALEYCMQNKVDLVNVGVMMAGQGSANDVFGTAETFVRKRAELAKERKKAQRYSKAQERARAEAAEEIRKRMSRFQKASDWFDGFLGTINAKIWSRGKWPSRVKYSVPIHRAIVVHGAEERASD